MKSSCLTEVVVSPELISTLGNLLSYGSIGLGLAVAVLAAILLATNSGKPQVLRAISRFMVFGLVLVVIGSATQIYGQYQSGQAEQQRLVVAQNLPDDFWNDFTVQRQQVLFGSAAPTNESFKGNMRAGGSEVMSIHLSPAECKYYFAAVKPPALINISIENSDVTLQPKQNADYYRSGEVCLNQNAKEQEISLVATVLEEDSQYTIKAFEAPAVEPSVAPQVANALPTVKIICTGQYEENCAGPHDFFYGCGTPPQTLASQICQPRTAAIERLSSKGGNQCGYDLLRVTCS